MPRQYWLDIEAETTAALSKLDAFLRRTWLECCGHLSMFSVPPFRYSSSPSDLPRLFGRANSERSMASKIGAVFSHSGQKGMYDYDFGSTTRLTMERSGARRGRIGKEAVRLLVRNVPLVWMCGVCGAPATLICCAHESDVSPFVCDAHRGPWLWRRNVLACRELATHGYVRIRGIGIVATAKLRASPSRCGTDS